MTKQEISAGREKNGIPLDACGETGFEKFIKMRGGIAFWSIGKRAAF